jgi:hypothetical protein
MGILDPLLKNEYMKQIYQMFGIRKPYVKREDTDHYKMPKLEENGGWLVLNNYDGPDIPKEEWEELEYVTYETDSTNSFAPITSATGEMKLAGFWDDDKPDKDGVWTENAKKCPTIVKWIKSVGANFGRVQLLRQAPTSWREGRYGLHLDDNNRLNPEDEGWVVRVWLNLTDDPDSYMILRKDEFDRDNEVRIPMKKDAHLVIDSENLFHAVYHGGDDYRYGLIVSFESGPELEKWIKSQGIKDFKTDADFSK